MFRRALTPTDIAKLWEAGSHGKCKESCSLPWSRTMCINQFSVVANFTIRNRTPFPQTYDLFAHGLPIGAMPSCTTTGPTGFVLTSPVTVAPFSTHVEPVTITRPFAMLPLKRGGYEVFAENQNTGEIMSARGLVYLSPNFCFGSSWGNTFPVPNGMTALLPSLPVSNLGPSAAQLNYQLVVRDSALDIDQSARLNGLPPGTPVTGSLLLGPGQNGQIAPVQIAFGESLSETELHLVLEADVDGDGIPDPLTSVQLVDTVGAAGTATAYGSGCGNAVIGIQGSPDIGSTFAVTLTGAPANTVAGCVIGFSRTSWNGMPLPMPLSPAAPGCNLLASVHGFPIVFTDAAGSATVPITLPADQGLIGVHLYCQWLVADPTANAGGFTTTAGIDVQIGG